MRPLSRTVGTAHRNGTDPSARKRPDLSAGDRDKATAPGVSVSAGDPAEPTTALATSIRKSTVPVAIFRHEQPTWGPLLLERQMSIRPATSDSGMIHVFELFSGDDVFRSAATHLRRGRCNASWSRPPTDRRCHALPETEGPFFFFFAT